MSSLLQHNMRKLEAPTGHNWVRAELWTLQEFCLLALSQPRPQASDDGSTIMARRSLSPRLQVSSKSTNMSLQLDTVHAAATCMRSSVLWGCNKLTEYSKLPEEHSVGWQRHAGKLLVDL